MNTTENHVGPKLRHDLRFELRTAPFRVTFESEFERLKNRLLARQLDQLERPELNTLVRRAANEAAALAWVTFYPLLVFPVLFEEKTDAVLRLAARQTRDKAKSS
jgi:hypothetical protein